jgi:LacI family transcriptional regulator
MAIKMKDVAERAGVSLITVSRVVNGTGYVHTETRAKVSAAIQELQYVPNQMASSLRSRQTRTSALLLPTITNSFWTTIARGAEDEAEARGYNLFLCNTDYDPEKERRYFAAVTRNRVDGIIIVPTPVSASGLHQLQARQMPLVLIAHKLDGVDVDVIRSDNFNGAAALTQSLIEAGWRRIAYVGGPSISSPGHDRLEGYRETLTENGIATDAALIKTGNADQVTGYRLVLELLDSGARPDALVIANSRLAIGALRALIDTGRHVPEDIAIATYHDISALDDYSSLMTTVVQPAYDMGRLAACRLFERIAGTPLPVVDRVLPNRIVPFGMSDPAAPSSNYPPLSAIVSTVRK